MNTLAIHHSKADRAVGELARAGITASQAGRSGDAIVFNIAPDDIEQASKILQKVQAAPRGHPPIRRVDPANVILLVVGVVGVGMGMMGVAVSGLVLGIVLGLVLLLLVLIMGMDAKGMRSEALNQLPKQAWESASAYNGRVKVGKQLSYLPVVGFIVLLIFTIAAVMLVEFIVSSAGVF